MYVDKKSILKDMIIEIDNIQYTDYHFISNNILLNRIKYYKLKSESILLIYMEEYWDKKHTIEHIGGED